MIYLDEDPVKFAERLGLEIKEIKCAACGETVIRDVPVRTKLAIGLVTRRHGECKNESGTFRPLGEFKKALENIV